MKKFKLLLIVMLLSSGCSSVRMNESSLWPQKNTELSTMLANGWKSLGENRHEQTLQIVSQCIDVYGEEAKRMNDPCFYMMDSAENYRRCIILDVVSQCVYIKFATYQQMKDREKMVSTCKELDKFYFNAYVWDPQGWHWKPVEACKEELGKEKLGAAPG